MTSYSNDKEPKRIQLGNFLKFRFLRIGALLVLVYLFWLLFSLNHHQTENAAKYKHSSPFTKHSSTSSVQEMEWKELNDKLSRQTLLLENFQKEIVALESKLADRKTPPRTPFYVERKMPVLPPTSTYCYGADRTSRVCRFTNLYYYPPEKAWFIIRDETAGSTLYNVFKNKTESGFLDASSLSDHNAFFWDYSEVSPNRFHQVNTRYVDRATFLLSRFHMGNIMHTIHDDFLGLYYMHKIFSPLPKSQMESERGLPFTLDSNIMFIDGYGSGDYSHIFELLTHHPIQYMADFLNSENPHSPNIIHYREAYVGNSKLANWYQYGFSYPQGPIPGKHVSGWAVREVAGFILKRLSMEPWDLSKQISTLDSLAELSKSISVEKPPSTINHGLHYPLAVLDSSKNGAHRKDSNSNAVYGGKFTRNTNCIVIFSRKGDRLLLNEDKLAETIHKVFKLPVRFLRMEEHNFKEQVSILRTAVAAIGMHGSMLIMSMFMPPGSLLIELYPFAVPAENYTPYKTLSGLPGMRIAYKSWTNTHPHNNVPHPERNRLKGGLIDFSPEERTKIESTLTVPVHICCTSPYWLFRIYQDTSVDISEVIALMKDGFAEARKALTEYWPENVTPSAVSDAKCSTETYGFAGDSNGGTNRRIFKRAKLEWKEPWNGVNPTHYGIWNHQQFTEYQTEDNVMYLDDICENAESGAVFDFWIRAYGPIRDIFNSNVEQSVHGPWTPKISCTCPNVSERMRSVTSSSPQQEVLVIHEKVEPKTTNQEPLQHPAAIH